MFVASAKGMKHFLFNFIGIVLLECVSFAKTSDVFSQKDFFKEEDTFNIEDNLKNQAEIHPSFKPAKINKLKPKPNLTKKGKNKSNPELIEDVQNALWTGTESGRTINTEILDSETFYDIFIANQCIYQTTKRYNQTGFLFPQNQNTNPKHEDYSPAFQKLNERNIKIAGFISGTQGAANIKENAIIGIVAYKEVVKNNKKEIRIFVIEECSQAEGFQFLGGIGGASWMTNFNAKKVEVNPKNLEIPNKYLSKSDEKLSFHEGFYNKIFSSKSSTEKCFKNLFPKLNIKNFEEIKNDLGVNESIAGLKLKEKVDQYNKCSVKIYVWGYSQGGGLIQVTAPYLTCWAGKYLYGDTFDNKAFNMVHAICFAPARAIGNAATLKVIENVMGSHNILGYCSYADAVPCLPLGSNIGYDPVKKHGMKLLQNVGKAICLILKDPFKSFLKTLCGAENFYETLNVWAYEDPFYLIKQYCTLSIDVAKKYIECLNDKNILPIACLQKSKIDVQKHKKEEIKNANKIINRLSKTQKKIGKVEKCFKAVQDAYFKAHTSDTRKSNRNIAKAVAHLTEMLIHINVQDFVAPQHFATYGYLTFKVNGKTYVTSLELGFHEELPKRDLQAAVNLGVEYHKAKAEKVKK